MTSLEETLAQGVKDDKIPHAVVFATNKDGSFTYKHAVGKMFYPDDTPIEEDAVIMLASQTKLLTSIAALQIVEKGVWDLDEDVGEKLPELAKQPVLKGFDESDKAILAERKHPITLRQLLTHSAGVAYDGVDPRLTKYVKQQGREVGSGTTILARYDYPMSFEPGTSWVYSCGIDWAGKLVERVTDMTLEDYMKKNMWQPLGIQAITFWAKESPELKGKVPTLVDRTPDGSFTPHNTPHLNTGSTDCFGGHGAYASMADYLKVQHSILANDGKLLKPETVEMMFTPQLGPDSEKALNEQMNGPFGSFTIGDWSGSKVNWGLGGILLMEDDGRRKKGTLSWGGMTNPYWLIDREANLALTFGTQVFPPGDKKVEEMISAVEKGVYEKAGVKM